MIRCVIAAIALLWLSLASGGLGTCGAQTPSPAIAGQEVDGQVSGNFRDVPLPEVHNAVLSANRYAYKQVGQDDATFISKVIALPSGLGDSDEIIDAARLLIGPRGEIRPISESGHVLVLGPSERVGRVKEMFNELARGLSPTPPDLPPLLNAGNDLDAASPLTELVPAETTRPPSSEPLLAYYTPQFTDAEKLIEALTGAMDPSTVINLFAEENRIIVRGDEDQLALIGGFGIETLPSDTELLPQRQEQRFDPQASEPFYQTARDPQVKDGDAPVRVKR